MLVCSYTIFVFYSYGLLLLDVTYYFYSSSTTATAKTTIAAGATEQALTYTHLSHIGMYKHRHVPHTFLFFIYLFF